VGNSFAFRLAGQCDRGARWQLSEALAVHQAVPFAPRHKTKSVWPRSPGMTVSGPNRDLQPLNHFQRWKCVNLARSPGRTDRRVQRGAGEPPYLKTGDVTGIEHLSFR